MSVLENLRSFCRSVFQDSAEATEIDDRTDELKEAMEDYNARSKYQRLPITISEKTRERTDASSVHQILVTVGQDKDRYETQGLYPAQRKIAIAIDLSTHEKFKEGMDKLRQVYGYESGEMMMVRIRGSVSLAGAQNGPQDWEL